MRTIIENVILIVLSFVIAAILIYAFDEWYQDKEYRREMKRRRREGRYE